MPKTSPVSTDKPAPMHELTKRLSSVENRVVLEPQSRLKRIRLELIKGAWCHYSAWAEVPLTDPAGEDRIKRLLQDTIDVIDEFSKPM